MTDVQVEETKPGMFSQFPKNFWVINALELFERGAYYTTIAILAVHLYDNLGYSGAETGLLMAILLFLLYFVPIIAAALAEKVGYRKTLMGAFVFMIAGYSLFGAVDSFALILISIFFLGVGAGTFKPIISASIAHMTTSEQRNQAYAIYYWMINVGAFAFPMIFAILKGTNVFDPEANSEYVFFASAGIISINLLIAFAILKDPAPPNPDKKISETFGNLVMVMKDKAFSTLLFIYAGFWFMFAMSHTFMPLYMIHFLKMPGWFSVFLLATFNPVTIVATGPFLSKLVKGKDPLKLMITGMSIFCIGLGVLGFTTIPALFIAGIIIFSLGEFITHPNFISYVSQIAPTDKVAIYMGFAFIPSGIGYVLGSFIGGHLFDIVAHDAEMPRLFWAIVTCVGLMTIIGFIMYDRKLAVHEAAPVEEATAEEAQIMTECIGCGTSLEGADVCPNCGILPTPGHVHEEEDKEKKKKGFLPIGNFATHHMAMIALIMIPIVLIAAISAGTNTYFEDDDDDEDDGPDGPIIGDIPMNHTEVHDEYLDDGQTHTYDVNVSGLVFYIKATLYWNEDNDDSYEPALTNTGDTFTLEMHDPENGSEEITGTNEEGQEETIDIEWDFIVGDEKIGIFTVVVTLDDTGDHWPLGVPSGGANDPGNEYTLTVEVEYYDII